MTSMTRAATQLASNSGAKTRRFARGSDTTVLTEIYQEGIDIVALQRTLSDSLKTSIGQFTLTNPQFNRLLTVSPESAFCLSRVCIVRYFQCVGCLRVSAAG